MRRLFLLIAAWCCLTTAVAAPHRNRPDTVTVRVMTFNLHAGHDASLQEIALLIKRLQPDFVALQEVDCNTHRAGSRHQNGRDFITELAWHSGLMGLYGPTLRFSGGLYGIGMLSRHPHCQSRNIMLPNPNPEMEQRALLEATFVLPSGDTIDVACTHLEAFDQQCREAQGEFLRQHYAAAPHPTVIAGDFNAHPDDAVIAQVMLPEWLDCTDRQPTFSTVAPEEKLDYIFARPRGRWRVVDTQVVPCHMSDHFPVVSTLQLLAE